MLVTVVRGSMNRFGPEGRQWFAPPKCAARSATTLAKPARTPMMKLADEGFLCWRALARIKPLPASRMPPAQWMPTLCRQAATRSATIPVAVPGARPPSHAGCGNTKRAGCHADSRHDRDRVRILGPFDALRPLAKPASPARHRPGIPRHTAATAPSHEADRLPPDSARKRKRTASGMAP